LRDLDTLAFGTVRLRPWLSVTGRRFTAAPGDRPRPSTLYPSTAERFDEFEPGLTQQPNYAHATSPST
jgi:hypothetical protein